MVRGLSVPLCTANKASGKLSVFVVILLNTERFIEEAIESVFTQIHGSWELLLGDEGSTDSGTRRPWSTLNGAPGGHVAWSTGGTRITV